MTWSGGGSARGICNFPNEGISDESQHEGLTTQTTRSYDYRELPYLVIRLRVLLVTLLTQSEAVDRIRMERGLE